MKVKSINLPFTVDIITNLNIGDKLSLNGKIITARDAAHKRMIECLDKGENLPFDLKNACLYYCGPTPAKNGFPVGACGPTTSGRMDVYTERLFSAGLRYMIGKGDRNDAVKRLITKHKGLYLVAIGGAGALYGQSVQKCRCLAYEDLGAEAVYELDVKGFVCYLV
jgi:fumarate hydratase subunit beta